jgi:hypothetical protein
VQLTPRLIAGLVAFGLAATGAAVGTLLMSAMIEQVNRKKPDDERISDLGSPPFKTFRILDEYHRLYPAGRLRVYYWGSFAFAMISLLGCAVCTGFFG